MQVEMTCIPVQLSLAFSLEARDGNVHSRYENVLSLCESTLSQLNFINNKHRTCLTDVHLKDSLEVALSAYTPVQYTVHYFNRIRCQAPPLKGGLFVKHQIMTQLNFKL